MLKENSKTKEYASCAECKELIGPSSAAVDLSYGFCNPDGSFYEEESIVIHAECSNREVLGRLFELVERA